MPARGLRRPVDFLKRMFFPHGRPWLRHDPAHREWSIGIYEGASPFRVKPSHRIRNPILTPRDVTDVRATTVADPFLLRRDQSWYLFFEVLNGQSGRGEIGLAVSADGLSWRYQQIVLAEPFHLSYPYVFEHEDVVYMIPESYEANSVRLYRAQTFPTEWSLVRPLLEGGYFVDSSVVQHEGMWWMFTDASRHFKHDTLRLFYASGLIGPWREHPQSPIVEGDAHIARPGGRIVALDGRLIRFSQDDAPTYGRQVWAFEITELTTLRYSDRMVSSRPILKRAWFGWNSLGMHHIDPHRTTDGRWFAYVDGLGVARRRSRQTTAAR